jgi:hypothetical protein
VVLTPPDSIVTGNRESRVVVVSAGAVVVARVVAVVVCAAAPPLPHAANVRTATERSAFTDALFLDIPSSWVGG